MKNISQAQVRKQKALELLDKIQQLKKSLGSPLSVINTSLQEAVSTRDKKRIIAIYNYVEKRIDLESVDDSDFETYNNLVTTANEILYE